MSCAVSSSCGTGNLLLAGSFPSSVHTRRDRVDCRPNKARNGGDSMKTETKMVLAAAVAALIGSVSAAAQEAHPDMSFFITSEGPGNGADLGGLEGADAHCQQLAEAVGAGGKTWRAYLSTTADDSGEAVNAR